MRCSATAISLTCADRTPARNVLMYASLSLAESPCQNARSWDARPATPVSALARSSALAGRGACGRPLRGASAITLHATATGPAIFPTFHTVLNTILNTILNTLPNAIHLHRATPATSRRPDTLYRQP